MKNKKHNSAESKSVWDSWKNASGIGKENFMFELRHQLIFKKHAPKIYDALDVIRRHSALGKQLVTWAKKNNVGFYQKEMKSLGLGGIAITCNTNNSTEVNVAVLAHELMHVIQIKKNGCGDDLLDRDGRSRIIHNRGLEAAAVACEIRILYEMKLNGHDKPWDDFKRNLEWQVNYQGDNIRVHDKYVIFAEYFEKTYNASRQKGTSEKESLKDACTSVHHAYFRSQPLRNTYNDIYLKQYINNIVVGSLYDLPPLRADIDFFKIYDMAKLDDDDFIIHNDIYMPRTDDEIFGDNILMRQAYDYVESVRVSSYLPQKNYGVLKIMEELKNDNNPYIGVDLGNVYSAMNDRNDIRTALEIMNDVSGIGNVKQFNLDFFERPQPRQKNLKV